MTSPKQPEIVSLFCQMADECGIARADAVKMANAFQIRNLVATDRQEHDEKTRIYEQYTALQRLMLR